MLTQEQIDALKRSRPRSRNRIAKAMELASVTQEQIAVGTGFTQSYVSRVRNGRYSSELPGETMRSFAAYFGCSIEDLFPSREAVAS